MSTKITEECVNCGACLPECPNEAIREDEGKSLHVIDPEKCSECVGFFAKEKCQEAAPEEGLRGLLPLALPQVEAGTTVPGR
jgi:ferredoxin